MLRRLTSTVLSAAVLIIAAFVASPCNAAKPHQMDSSPLVKLAAARFLKLTRAELALLEHAEVKNVGRADYAICGPSANPADASNNPKDAAKWGADREIRA